MKKRLLSAALALTLGAALLTPAAHAAEASWTGQDAYGNPAPAIEGVKWYLAPTVDGWVTMTDIPDYVRYNHNGGNGVLDRFGAAAVPEKYAYAEPFPGGFSADLSRNAYESSTALFSTDGTQVTEHIYQQTVPESYYADETGHFIQVYGGTRDGADDCRLYVNLDTGEELPRCKDVGYFCEGLAGFQDFDGRTGYMDTKGNKHYAPENFSFVWTLPGGVLGYYIPTEEYKSISGICNLDFEIILQAEDDDGSFYVSDCGVVVDSPAGSDLSTLYDFTGKVLVPAADRNYDIFLNDKGERCASYWDKTPGKRAERVLNLDTGETTLGENDGLPEGYYKDGKQELVGFDRVGTIGIKGPDGSWVVPQNYLNLEILQGTDKPMVAAMDHNEKVVLYDLTGKKLIATGYEAIENFAYWEKSDGAYGDFTVIPGIVRAKTGRNDMNHHGPESFAVYSDSGKKLTALVDDAVATQNGFMTQTWVNGDYGKPPVCNLYKLDGTLAESDCGYYVPYLNELNEGLVMAERYEAGGDEVVVTKEGYSDDKFDVVIPCVFDCALESQGGQMWVQYEGKWGIIDNPLNDTAERAWAEHPAAAEDTANAADFLAKLPAAEQSHWAAESFGKLGAMGIVSGYPDGHFGPDDSVTRGSMAKLVLESSGRLGRAVRQSETPAFADAAGAWSAPYINGLAAAGILAPADYPEGFQEGGSATRAEVAKMLVRALGYTDDGGVTATPFPDVTADQFYIAKAAELGIITGYPDGRFGPSDPVTRGTAAVMLVRAMDVAK